jgi:hypothetical protein
VSGGAATSSLGLALLLPLIESQSKTDPTLCCAVVTALLGFLNECDPLVLKGKFGSTHVEALQALVSRWFVLARDGAEGAPVPIELAAGSLVALACARGDVFSVVGAVHQLSSYGGPADALLLPIGHNLKRMLAFHQARAMPTTLGRKNQSWAYGAWGATGGAQAPEYHHPSHAHAVQLNTTQTNAWHCDGGCGYRSQRPTAGEKLSRFRSLGGEDFDLCTSCMGATLAQGRCSMCVPNTNMFTQHSVRPVPFQRGVVVYGPVYPACVSNGLIDPCRIFAAYCCCCCCCCCGESLLLVVVVVLWRTRRGHVVGQQHHVVGLPHHVGAADPHTVRNARSTRSSPVVNIHAVVIGCQHLLGQ